jgi:altronate dehydratase small subunit
VEKAAAEFMDRSAQADAEEKAPVVARAPTDTCTDAIRSIFDTSPTEATTIANADMGGPRDFFVSTAGALFEIVCDTLSRDDANKGRSWRMTSNQTGGATDRRLLLLNEADNVLVATARIRAGEEVLVEGRLGALPIDLPIGHKLSRRAIAAGEKIVKYGAPIGSASADIAALAHVHVHNVRSDYTPTYHLEESRAKYRRGT